MNFSDIVKQLRNGDEVICPLCKEGHLISDYDNKKSSIFYCDKCKEKLIIN